MAITRWIPFAVAQQASSSSAASAQVDGPLVAAVSSADSKEFGLENFGNTCYANSVLQTLYFCNPFRELLLQLPDPSAQLQPLPAQPQSQPVSPPQPIATARRKPERKFSVSEGRTAPDSSAIQLSNAPVPTIPSSPPTLASALRSLFVYISKNPADKGTVAPRAFIEKLRQLNEIFRTQMHQDAHEFLNYLLNRIVEEIELERRHGNDSDLPASLTSTPMAGNATATLVHTLFEGVLTSETRCLTCETVSSRDESFLDLSIDIEQNSSLTACLRQFSASEMLCQKNKFFCDSCCDLQEAEKRMKIKKLPNVLALHLKRFKYQEDVQKYIKLTYRVAFSMELRLFNTVDDVDDPDRLYELYGIVVHIGNGPHHGHYVSIIKANGSWKVFDDDTVDTIRESDIPKYFGDSNNGAAYVLYYQAVDMDLSALGLEQPTPAPVAQPVPEGPAEELSAPALPPGLISENETSDVGESSGPTTPTASNSGHSPEINGSPVPPKLHIPPSELPPPLSSTMTASTQQKNGGGIFQSLRHMPSSRVRSTIGSSDHRKSLLVPASMAASSSSSQSTATPPSSRPISRPETVHGSAGGSVPSVSEPPALPSSRDKAIVNGKEGWLRRKSFRIEREKDKDKDLDTLAATFAAVRLEKGKTKHDDSTWLHATHSPQIPAEPAKLHNGHYPALSPTSTAGSQSPRSDSSSYRTPSHELSDPHYEPPPRVTKRSSTVRPSTAGARLAGSTTSMLPPRSTAGSPVEDLPSLPYHPALLDSPHTTRSPDFVPRERRRESPAPHDKLSNMNGNGYKKRPSSAHADVSPGRTEARASSPRSTGLARPTQTTSKATTNGTSTKKAWKRLTGNFLGFGRKDKHRDSG